MRKIFMLLALFSLAVLTGCTRVESGEVGLEIANNGVIQGQPLQPGWHASVFSTILVFTGKEVLVPLEKQTPQTADHMAMDDVEVRFAYAINPNYLMDLYTHYSTSYNLASTGGHETYAMLGFVDKLATSAINDQVQKYNALDVNGHRGEIASAIENDVRGKLMAEGLLTMLADGKTIDDARTKIRFGQVVIAQAVPPKALLTTIQSNIDAQNKQLTVSTEAQSARIRAQGIADAAVIAAKGEAQAIQVKTDALKAGGGDYLTLQSIEKWDGKLPESYYAGQPVPFVGAAIHPAK